MTTWSPDAVAGPVRRRMLTSRIGHTGAVTEQRPEGFRQPGGAFAVGGDRYERLRPGYPDDAVAFLVVGTDTADCAVVDAHPTDLGEASRTS
jgi:hypothetical protein